MGKHVVTGGAGFIGSHLVERLLKEGHKVLVLDNMSNGNLINLERCKKNKMFEIKKIDLLNDNLLNLFSDTEMVWHLAANADVRICEINTKIPIQQNFITTWKVLEAMRVNEVKNIVFTSTSTVYGESKIRPTPEEYGPLKPVSLYGSSKLAAESLISSYCYTFDMRSWIYRLANVIGSRSNHGIIYDLIKKLNKDPTQLEILGDGEQDKSYVHILDCLDAIFIGLKGNDQINIYNIGSEDTIKVKKIVKHICVAMKLKPKLKFTGGRGGWKTDVPKMQLDIKKIKSIGWEPKNNSEEAVKKTIKEMVETREA